MRNLPLPLFLLCIITFSQAAPPPTPPTAQPVTVDQLLATSSPTVVLKLVNNKAAEMIALLSRVVDESSARELRPSIEKTYLELELIGTRVNMLPRPTAEERAQLDSLHAPFVWVREQAAAQCDRLNKLPAVAAELRSVLPLLSSDLNGMQAARASSLLSQIQTLRSQIVLYQLQHKDALPDFRTQGWKQLTSKTTEDGRIDSSGTYGPYMQSPPVNPLTVSSRILLIKGQPKPGVQYAKTKAGFLYDPATGKIWALAPDGCLFQETLAHADAR